MAAKFHNRSGSLVRLCNGNRTAKRNNPTQEFSNAVVLSSEPLRDNQLFEVRIDKKVYSWSGSIEIGVTTCDPTTLNFPVSASSFREGTWVMSGSTILKDGHSINEEYDCDLDRLGEGDRVGVLRTSQGALHFFVNEVDHGPAATGIPSKVYAVVDMYGKCAQVTIVDETTRENVFNSNIMNELANEFLAELSNQIATDLVQGSSPAGAADRGGEGEGRPEEQGAMQSNEKLVFHEKCGNLVKLSNSRLTAERTRPLDEFNNGVVMTNRPLKMDELFEIQLDQLVDKWSGSIEVGITTHNPAVLDFPPTMTNMRSGTIMMSGCGILTNGKGTRREYGQFNLDELAVGDRIGLVRKTSGALHYYINGMDQGVAATDVSSTVWGVVDLYGMAVKVTIIDSHVSANCTTNAQLQQLQESITEQRGSNTFQPYQEIYEEEALEDEDAEKLLFHPHCGFHAAVINGLQTAFRPNAHADFNYGVVLTNRPLRPNELFEVRIDRMVDKWAGSIEIGVTTHSPTTLEFPSTMTNVRSGTWMMTSNGVMHNGTTVMDEYGQSLDRLKIGDRVGVMRKRNGCLHFFVNHIDQGLAATNVPEIVYGVIDLYGQAAQATVVDQSESLTSPEMDSSVLTDVDELRFHHLHGNNATIMNNGKTTTRPNATGEFNDAIVMSNRPLKDNELFEVVIERMVDRWSGSIEAGVTLIKPEDLEFPNTMTDIEYDTWMLSGSAIMQDGLTIRNGYPLDLDSVSVGCRIGMMRKSDGTLHYFLDGVDQGTACRDLPSGLYAVIDLYGQCAQVTITSGHSIPHIDNLTSTEMDQSLALPANTEISHRFSQCCGKNVAIKHNGSTACRVRHFNHGLVFSSDPLKYDELFEVKIDQLSSSWSGSLRIGLTTLPVSDSMVLSLIPANAEELTSKVTWIVSESHVKKNGLTIRENYVPTLDRLEVGNRVGVKRCADGTMHLYVNGEDLGTAASNIPKNVFAVIDLFGRAEMVSVISKAVTGEGCSSNVQSPSLPSDTTSSIKLDGDQDQDTAEALNVEFHGNHGKNIVLSNQNLDARRTSSYNQAIVVTKKPLIRNQLVQFRIDSLNSRWSSSLIIGVIGFSPEKYKFPVSAMSIKKSCITIQTDSVFNCGVKVKDRYGPNLDSLQCGHAVGVFVNDDNCLHLHVNGVDQGLAARDVPNPCHVIVDLYGQTEQISIITDYSQVPVVPYPGEDREKADLEDVVKEKACRISIESKVVRNCEYQNICSRLLAMLSLPEAYFDKKVSMCYCETCHKVRGDKLCYKCGDPPREYALPCGWCRFTVRPPCKAHTLNVCEKWHTAYYGTCLEVVRKILDSGDLHRTGEIAAGNSILLPQPGPYTEKSKPDSGDRRQIFLSPTIRYAGCGDFTSKHKFTDPKTKKIYDCRIAFQVWVKPSSYKVGPQSIGANEQIDPCFSNNELEWSTKERGSIMLYGLLVKIE